MKILNTREIDTIEKILRRYERTKKFKETGYSMIMKNGCGGSKIISIEDNRNSGHSFEISFDVTGKLNDLDFGFYYNG